MYSNAIIEPSGPSACAESIDSLQELAALPRWSTDRVRRLPGRCRGHVLARWAEGCRRRFGSPAIRHIRDKLGPLGDDLPEEPPEHAWFPVSLQIEITDIVIEDFLGGDAAALEPLLMADIERSMGRLKRTFLRSVGPAPILQRAGPLHDHLYDVGQAHARTTSNAAVLHLQGAELFGNPTWQVLQLIAHRGLVLFGGRELVHLRARMPADNAFEVDLSWR